MKKLHQRFRSLFTNHLGLPSDVILEIPKITVIGKIHVYIENYEELIYFSDSELKLKTNIGFIQVLGSSFILKLMIKEEILLEGTITEVKLITN